MNLLLIMRKIWRYRLATLPVIILTCLGAAYVVTVKKPVYEVSSSYILINPPAPPTTEAIARDPALGRINPDNPYARFPDQSVVVQVLASTLGTESARRTLKELGADSRYILAPASEFGYSSPIMEITGVGSSPQAAIRTAEVVGEAVTRELDRMQQAQGVAKQYRIETQPVNIPDDPQLRASGQLRMLIGVLALGTITMFVVVSAADALTTLRMERMERTPRSRPTSNDQTGSAQGEPGEGPSGRRTDNGSGLDNGSPGGGPADPWIPIGQEPPERTDAPVAVADPPATRQPASRKKRSRSRRKHGRNAR